MAVQLYIILHKTSKPKTYEWSLVPHLAGVPLPGLRPVSHFEITKARRRPHSDFNWITTVQQRIFHVSHKFLGVLALPPCDESTTLGDIEEIFSQAAPMPWSLSPEDRRRWTCAKWMPTRCLPHHRPPTIQATWKVLSGYPDSPDGKTPRDAIDMIVLRDPASAAEDSTTSCPVALEVPRTPDNWGEGQFAMSDFLGPQTLEMSLKMSEIWAIKRSKVSSRIGKIRVWDSRVWQICRIYGLTVGRPRAQGWPNVRILAR